MKSRFPQLIQSMTKTKINQTVHKINLTKKTKAIQTPNIDTVTNTTNFRTICKQLIKTSNQNTEIEHNAYTHKLKRGVNWDLNKK